MFLNGNKDTKSSNTEKPKKHVQFSKKVVILCTSNLFLIEFFSMWMIFKFGDTSQLSYLITAIAAECLGCVIWYMKNSETEKKARIQAEVDMKKIDNYPVNQKEDNSFNDRSYNDMDSLLNSVDSIVGSTNSDSSNAVG